MIWLRYALVGSILFDWTDRVDARTTKADGSTGAVRTYANNQGVAFAPIQDTAAF